MSKTLEINSPKHGKFIVQFDEIDSDFILPYKWGIRFNKGKAYARRNAYKDGENNYIDMHRMLLGFPGYKIDHIDGNSLNNTRRNLREATQNQNAKNMKLSKLNKFGFKGVSFDKVKKKFSCYITHNYKHIFGGYFDTPINAAIKYNELAIKYHGEFAHLNKI